MQAASSNGPSYSSSALTNKFHIIKIILKNVTGIIYDYVATSGYLYSRRAVSSKNFENRYGEF
jgi:hypothetical protein